MDEFELVSTFFDRPQGERSWVKTGIGDDGAVLKLVPGTESVVVTDTLVCGVHFFSTQAPCSVGHRALAVNLSDIAAMGAKAQWSTLNLTLPNLESTWIAQFADGLLSLADRYDVALIGGDTTQGPLSVTMTVGGYVNPGEALYRSGAHVGDLVYVSGCLGGAAAALQRGEGQPADALGEALWFPEPRLSLANKLRGIAHSAVDISDGLLADLTHVLKASGSLGADIESGCVPLFDIACEQIGRDRALELALTGGDDYELCFTAAPQSRKAISAVAASLDLPLTCIGRVTSSGGCRVTGWSKALEETELGYRHSWDVDT